MSSLQQDWLLVAVIISQIFTLVSSDTKGMVGKKNHYLLSVGFVITIGYVFTRGGYVELSKRLSLPLGRTLDRYEILAISIQAGSV